MGLRVFGILGAALFSLAICNGQGTISTFFATGSSGLAIDGQGTVYLTDSATARVRKISSGTLSTIAGNGNFGYAGDGGPAINATLNLGAGGLAGLAVDGLGNAYFADSSNNVIRKISAAGIISTYAGNGTAGFAGDSGAATSAQLNGPTDVAIDGNGNLYICDSSNNRVRKVTPGGTITTFAGNGHVVFESDGVQAATTAVPSPAGIAVDAQGNVYISSAVRVRKVTPDGIITTIAGNGTRGFSGDGGPATAATFRGPIGLAVDAFGNVYVTDNSNGRVRKIDAAGTITTYAGIDGNASTPLGDGGPATSAYLGTVGDLALDSSGNLYVATGGNNGRIRKIQPSGAGFTASPASLTFSYSIGGSAPASQTLNITSSGGVLTYTASASSTGNWLSVSPATGSTPGTLTVSANPAGLAGGATYQGSILLTPPGSGNSPLTINVSITVAGAGAPRVNSGGIFNATGYQTKLAPDTVFTLFGANLGPASLVPATGPNYPDNLSGTSIRFTPVGGGAPIAARLVYTLASQVAGILPSSIGPGTYAVTVTYNTLTSAPQNVTVVARSFGIAAANSAGSGTAQATIANINGGLSLTRFTAGSLSFGGNTWTLSPAHPDDSVVLWGTGGGADPQNDAGGSSGDQTAAGNFVVTVGTRQITPLYAGTSFGYPGLFQINFKLPTDIATDCFTTVTVTAGGEISNTVVIPIAAASQSSCTDPATPASILSKIDAGANINIGAFAIAKMTASNVTQETASGSVFSFTPTEWTILNSGPAFGACRLYDRTYASGGKDPGSPDGFLNAGTRLALSGPNLAAGSGLGAVSTALGPSYAASFANGTLGAGGSYTISGAGGTDVGAFTSTTVFPPSFTATNFGSITTINRTQPLTFTWSGTGIDQVAIILTSSVTGGGLVHITTLNCNVPAGPGSYTVPAAALAGLLPAAATGTAFGSVSIEGLNTQGKFTANLTKGGELDLGTFWSNTGVAKNIAVQ
uniref:NHL repeat containing protein n=1 Tax=Solibacter usitatus (strain Ellin6076) TaxID=234267 RepID=Q01T33_SOLUE